MVLSVLVTFVQFFNDLLAAIYRDIKGILLVIKLESKLKTLDKEDTVLADLFRKLVRKHPDKTCISYYDQKWTYQDVIIYTFINKLFPLVYR